MRSACFALVLLPALLCGCGGGSPATALSVSCEGRTALAGAKTIDVLADAQNGGTTLSFPDPANSGQTATIVVRRGTRCTVTPEAQ